MPVNSFPWPKLRYKHTAATRAALAARYKPATANKMLSAVRGVLKECQKLGWMGAEDFQRAINYIPTIKATTLLRGRALTSSEITALRSACSREAGPAGARDGAIIEVLYAGLRRSEIVKLDYHAYNQHSNELTIPGANGGNDRNVYLPDGARKAMKAWLRLRGSHVGPLFCHINKADRISPRRLTGQGIWYILQKRGGEAGVESFSPHDLRRSCITHLLAEGADIVVVQQLAGHSDPKTTMRYDRGGDEAKRTAAEKPNGPQFPQKLAA